MRGLFNQHRHSSVNQDTALRRATKGACGRIRCLKWPSIAALSSGSAREPGMPVCSFGKPVGGWSGDSALPPPPEGGSWGGNWKRGNPAPGGIRESRRLWGSLSRDTGITRGRVHRKGTRPIRGRVPNAFPMHRLECLPSKAPGEFEPPLGRVTALPSLEDPFRWVGLLEPRCNACAGSRGFLGRILLTKYRRGPSRG